MPKIIRILSKDHVSWRYFVNFLPQSLSYVCCFISFTFAFEIDHVQQRGERMESGGHSNSFGGARPTNAPPWRRPCPQDKIITEFIKITPFKSLLSECIVWPSWASVNVSTFCNSCVWVPQLPVVWKDRSQNHTVTVGKGSNMQKMLEKQRMCRSWRIFLKNSRTNKGLMNNYYDPFDWFCGPGSHICVDFYCLWHFLNFNNDLMIINDI